MRKLLFITFIAFVMGACQPSAMPDLMVKRQNHQFIVDGKPYYFVGTNYWYGAILASTGQGGDRERLLKELDLMKQSGINNLRVLVGAEGPNGEPYRVTPALQLSPGVYNDTILDGLDFLLNEMGKRQMYAVLYLHNSWEWSGGYAQYLSWNGYGAIPYPEIAPHTWSEFMKYASQFHACEPCKLQFKDHIKFVVSRTNRYSEKKYVDDAAIMTWEIGNEPRAFTDENKPRFAQWISETAAFIKSIDPNHLITTGTEGRHGCEKDMELFKQIHADPNIDYLTMHIWPKNWGWLDNKRIVETIDSCIVLTKKYMNDHILVAQELNKPLVLEEFGLPRDHHLFTPDDTTIARDKFYASAFQMVEENQKANGVLAGSNFWAFTGAGRHHSTSSYWANGDDLMGDPPQEEQGLNSVYDVDSTTISLIKDHAQRLTQFNN
jgi:mannan endo-1,4-beta-mannosidase